MAPRTLLLAVLALSAFLSGCGKKVADVCEEKCGAQAPVCKVSGEQQEAIAEERGCESEFEALVTCTDEKGSCATGVLDPSSACAAEAKALNDCVQ